MPDLGTTKSASAMNLNKKLGNLATPFNPLKPFKIKK
jgi:hypothetical protein